MTTRALTLLPAAAAAALVLLASAPRAWAADPCITEAKIEARECKAACREALQTATDDCLDRDHACVEACRAERAECREATGFDAAIDACNATRDDARQACREAYPAGSPERDQCIDQVQVVAFQCRDAAREQAKRPLKECRKQFRRCARGCARNDPPDRAGRSACRDEAKTAYKRCQAECREDLQVEKDACRNRDHACAEDCRAARAECRRPIREQHAADVAACNATRDQAIANCKSLFAPDTPARDTCIDNAQVDAFRCRDEAREAARPGLRACRDDFRACVRACPPPAAE